jgi:NAD(P) transhydrogenase
VPWTAKVHGSTLTLVTTHYDLVVVGSGPAGEKGAALAAYHGRRVAVVERAAEVGGTMAGGVAGTKTMREAAIYLTSFRRRSVYGVGVDVEPRLAAQVVRDRAQRVEAQLADSVRTNLAQHGIDLIHGSARLLGPGEVAVDSPDGKQSRVLTADVVLLATGSRPFHPAGMPFTHPAVLDSDSARRLDRPVPTLVVIGGGAVACEYASIFAALGTQVTLVESRGQLLPFVDAGIAELLTETFREMGIDVVLSAGHAEVTVEDDTPVVRLPDGRTIEPATVIVAAGRVGNTEDLGLTAAGVAVDGRGHVVVDENYETTARGVFAAGDVIGPPALASVSMEQGRAAASHAFGIGARDTIDRQAPLGVYSIPEVGMIGLTEAAARSVDDDVEIGQARLSRNARTTITGDPHGLVKLVFRRSDRKLLGAHVLGDHATELIHQAHAVMHFGGTIDFFIDATMNTPTESEAFKYAAYDGLSRLEHRRTLTVNV